MIEFIHEVINKLSNLSMYIQVIHKYMQKETCQSYFFMSLSIRVLRNLYVNGYISNYKAGKTHYAVWNISYNILYTYLHIAGNTYMVVSTYLYRRIL